MRPAASWGIGEGREEERVFCLQLVKDTPGKEQGGKPRKCGLEETLGTYLCVYKIQTYVL